MNRERERVHQPEARKVRRSHLGGGLDGQAGLVGTMVQMGPFS